VLAALGIAFLGAFAFQRAQSRVLAVERQGPALRALARAQGLSPAAVFALREQTTARDDAAFAAEVAAFAALAADLGEPLAAVAVAGGEAAARRALAAAGGDPARAWAAFAASAEALPGVRFEQLRARFAARAAARAGD
jgi:hypothetical protein